MNLKKSIFILLTLIFLSFSLVSEKKSSNGFSDYFISTEFVFDELDSSEIFTTDTFGKIKKEEIELVYLDKTDYFGFAGPSSLSYVYVLFDENARKKLANAEEMYLSDFENKRLDRKGKRSDKIYGHIPTKTVWGAIKMQAKNTGLTNTYFGYKFKDGSPYFTITCPETNNEKYDPNYNRTAPKSSFTSVFYLTKAQLKALTSFLSEDNVSNYLFDINSQNYTEYENDAY